MNTLIIDGKKTKGTLTKEHRIAIQAKGITQLHRKSFKQLPTQLKLTFNTIYILIDIVSLICMFYEILNE